MFDVKGGESHVPPQHWLLAEDPADNPLQPGRNAAGFGGAEYFPLLKNIYKYII